MNQNTKLEGFTLVELAISLLIIGLLLAGILGPMSTRIEQKERQTTQETLNDIKESLIGFAITNGRLPCPDFDITTPDGIENPDPVAIGDSCAASSGILPYVTLGVPSTDPWNRPFFYRVSDQFADNKNDTPCGTATVGVSFELCSVGDITINDHAGAKVVDLIPAVVFSGGQNNFTSSTLEQENTDDDETFVFTDYREEPNQEFDDLMIWISPNILKSRMVQAGRLP